MSLKIRSKGAFRLAQRLDRFPDVVPDQVRITQRAQVPARQGGETLIPDDVIDDPAAVFLDPAGKPGGRIAVTRTQLKNPFCSDQAGQLVALITGGRPDNREMLLARIGFHRLHLGRARGDKLIQVMLDGS